MIAITQLQKVNDQGPALDIDQLEIEAGQIAAIVGPTGSGKHVLLELLLGQSRPTMGEISLAGINPLDRAAFSRKVGVLFAEDTLYKRQSARGNLSFHARLHGLARERGDEVLAMVGLADQAQVKVEKLTSGLVRRLAFGVALLHQPEVLLLLEPFARCDEATISLLRGLMRQLADDGLTLLILADDTAHLETICDTVMILENGRITATSHPQEEQAAGLPFKIPVRLEESVVLVNPGEIFFAEVQDGRTYLQLAEDRLPTRFTLIELEERLARSGFFRAHRSYLVNLQHVREVIPYTRSSFTLKLDDAAATQIPLSKEAARELRELWDY